MNRGANGTTQTSHLGAANVLKIDAADHLLVQSDDDFGFGEIFSEYTDMKKYDPDTGADVDI